MNGTVVFSGTRVPFQTLIDYLEAGQPLSEFLEDFPTVSSEQAIAALGESQRGASHPCASCLTSVFLGPKTRAAGARHAIVPEMGWVSKREGDLRRAAEH